MEKSIESVWTHLSLQNQAIKYFEDVQGVVAFTAYAQCGLILIFIVGMWLLFNWRNNDSRQYVTLSFGVACIVLASILLQVGLLSWGKAHVKGLTEAHKIIVQDLGPLTIPDN